MIQARLQALTDSIQSITVISTAAISGNDLQQGSTRVLLNGSHNALAFRQKHCKHPMTCPP